jgi:5-formyltetrahydrofolate cyclo-ligase
LILEHADTHALKANLRREAAVRRKQAHMAHPQAGLALMQHFKSAIAVPAAPPSSGFWPMGDEMDVNAAAVATARRRPSDRPAGGGEKGPAADFPWLATRPSAGERRLRHRDPAPSAAEVVPDVLIVPLLAFDSEGYRLGYGGGFYDRTLHKLRGNGNALAVGVGYAAQHVARVPRDEYDQPLDWIVTEKGAHSYASHCRYSLRWGCSMRLLFLGDLVGRSGRDVVVERLPG